MACSAGGHLTELTQVAEAYADQPHYFVTDRRVDSEEFARREKVFFVTCPRRNPLRLLLNFFESLHLVWREDPDVVISTGADTAFFTCLLGKIFGAKLVFIESFARITKPSLTGKLLYPFADKFFVQWPDLKADFPKAEFAGSVF